MAREEQLAPCMGPGQEADQYRNGSACGGCNQNSLDGIFPYVLCGAVGYMHGTGSQLA